MTNNNNDNNTTSSLSSRLEERYQRWANVIKSKSKNVQIQGQEPPETEEGFLVLTIIDGKSPGIKEFVVTHMVTEVANRQRNRAEYFTTAKDGNKIGVSLEWRRREEAWKNLSDKDLEEINKTVDEAVKRKDDK
jgi:hypothetical protein